jgi:lipopolysaccharide export system protein LptA
MGRITVVLILVFSLTGLLISGVVASSEQEITVRSDSMRIEELKGVIQFMGNVVLTYQEAVLTCNTLVLLTENKSPSGVQRGIAEGNVVITHLEDRAEADRAEFDVASDQVDLTGSPKLIRDRNIISATKITYFLDSGIANFEGPVEATIITPEETE